MRFEVCEAKGGEYRWRAKSSNGQIAASGGESFSSKRSPERAAENVRVHRQDHGTVSRVR